MPSGLNWAEVMCLVRRDARKDRPALTARQRQVLSEGRDERGKLLIDTNTLCERLGTQWGNVQDIYARGATRLLRRYGRPESAPVSFVIITCVGCGCEVGAFWHPTNEKAPYALGWPRCRACAQVAALPKDEEEQ